ncbi:hypothetical protein [Okeania sp. SIO1H2]|uniref:hypothetical protein n=1 Tax=Okeania sp. SIO1H2 TaxID=2607775 RepID=UPI00141C0E26|nr:hypothetical protein [Okeania sp. SIO1H2]NET94192.1 hypothetical protein [Okeania sp. SIO1H2]
MLKHVYDINPNYLGVNPPARPSQEGESGVRRRENYKEPIPLIRLLLKTLNMLIVKNEKSSF